MDNTATDEVDRLLGELKDDRRDVRSRAAYELGKHHDPRVLMPLVAALRDNDKFVRSWAAGALGKMGPEAIDPIVAVLEASEPAISCYAALALGELGDLRAVPVLADALREGDWDIRPSAAAALTGLGDSTILPDRILAEESLPAARRVAMLTSLNGAAYTGDELQVRYSIPDLTAFCRQRTVSDDPKLRMGAVQSLQILESVPPAPLEPPALSDESPQPSAWSSEGDKLDTLRSDALDAHKPKRSFWDRLTGR